MEKSVIDKEFDILGYKTGIEFTKMDSDLLRIKEAANAMNLELKGNIGFYNRNKIVKNAEDFFNHFLILRDVKYISEKLKENINFKAEFLDFDKTTIKREVNNSLKMISPFALPIFKKNYSALEASYYDDSVYLTGISLERGNTKNNSCGYCHEIIHSQLYMVKGSVLNYKNGEVLTIFFELLSAFYFDKSGSLLNNVMKQRYDHVLYVLNLLTIEVKDTQIKLNSSMYTESSLIAIKLFDLYMNGNSFIKKEIMGDIQKIIDGKLVLEDMLNKYGINFESCKQENIFKKYIK